MPNLQEDSTSQHAVSTAHLASGTESLCSAASRQYGCTHHEKRSWIVWYSSSMWMKNLRQNECDER
jgi:hypothetical protein